MTIVRFVKRAQEIRDCDRRRSLIKLVAVAAIVSFCSGCFQDRRQALDDFELAMKESDRAELNGDYATAEQSTIKAEAIARSIDWTNGVIAAKIQLAGIYIGSRRNDKAESAYLEAKTYCLSKKCKGLGEILESVFVFDVIILRDAEKASAVIDELVDRGSAVGGKEVVVSHLQSFLEISNTAGCEDLSRKLELLIASGGRAN